MNEDIILFQYQVKTKSQYGTRFYYFYADTDIENYLNNKKIKYVRYAKDTVLNKKEKRIRELFKENKQLKEKLDIENINYKTLSADIGTVAEYMKLDKDAIIEEMITRSVELANKEHIIDELEKWLEERIDMCFTTIPDYEIYIARQEEKHILQEVLNKLQELKGSDKE